MTAIALLNIENDPHVLADTFLSAKGADPNPRKEVWLPALGSIKSEWGSAEDLWYIARLGRKTFILPNNSGILSFSGDCKAAFDFWSEWSKTFLNTFLYDAGAHVTAEMLERVLNRLKGREKFNLLGILRGPSGRRVPFIHNLPKKVMTNNFGTCYVAGSGTEIVSEIITTTDAYLSRQGGWKSANRISATEDLAEHISSHMLYRESDWRNGKLSGSPIDMQCGGFFEWYRVEQDGIRPLKSRIELHFLAKKNKLYVTRIYFAEQVQSKGMVGDIYPRPLYYISVLSLIHDRVEVQAIDAEPYDFALQPEEVHGVLIDSTFSLYDSTENDPPSRISGKISAETLENMFSDPLEIRRVRIVVSAQERASTKGFIASRDEEFYGRISMTDKLGLEISSSIIAAALDMAARLAPNND